MSERSGNKADEQHDHREKRRLRFVFSVSLIRSITNMTTTASRIQKEVILKLALMRFLLVDVAALMVVAVAFGPAERAIAAGEAANAQRDIGQETRSSPEKADKRPDEVRT
jgi:hypothetical protein